MSRPLIAITTGPVSMPAVRGRPQRTVAGCNIAYPLAVERSGGAPLLMPCTAQEEVVEALVEGADGLLLSGGGDVVPAHYGQAPHQASYGLDPVRDRMEFCAISLALRRGLPILGICRGIQALNVAFGGTLVQDIASQVPGALVHRASGDDDPAGHMVRVDPGSLLGRVLGVTELLVNSYHHQAVQHVGVGLVACCRAPDGIIEGLEAADGRPVLAVQWHPEDGAERDPLSRRLFDWLVQEASLRKS